jgi:hypothetical protein
MPIPGTYRHFKGSYYDVIGEATHTETEEKMVVYVDKKDPSKIWVRPLEMFLSSVLREDGVMVPRFRFISKEWSG